MRKMFKRIASSIVTTAIAAASLCSVMATSANAATTQYKTYVVYNIAQNSSIAFFDICLQYTSDVTAETSIKTGLLNNGYFNSVNASNKVQSTYMGSAIGATGNVFSTKFIAPMSTTSIFDKVTYSAVIRNANNITLSPTSIILDSVLLGDANQDGVVNMADATAIMSYVSNPDKYPLSEKGLIAADVNGYGITNSDALMIQMYILGNISNF